MIKPLVSIQIPTYNQKSYIKEALNSACSQTYENKEIIISDDCSTYDINEYLNESIGVCNLKIINNKINLGRVKNYKSTLYNHVNGKYFINLDGDDYFTDNLLIEKAVDTLENFQKYNPVVFQYNHDIIKIRSIIKDVIEIDESTILIDGKKYFKNLHKINEFSHAASLFNARVAKSINFYSINSLSSDFNSASRILLEGSIIISSKKVCEWRKHDNNATWTLGTQQYLSELKSNKNIIEAAIGIIDPKELLILKNALNFGLYNKMIHGFKKSNNYKEQIKFIFLNSKINFSYFKVNTRFIYYKLFSK